MSNAMRSAVPAVVTDSSMTTIGTGTTYSLSTSSVGGITTTAVPAPTHAGTLLTKRTGTTQDVEGAVYGFLRAMRTLGHTNVRPEDVSRALGISVSAAMASLQALEGKGVRRSK